MGPLTLINIWIFNAAEIMTKLEYVTDFNVHACTASILYESGNRNDVTVVKNP